MYFEDLRGVGDEVCTCQDKSTAITNKSLLQKLNNSERIVSYSYHSPMQMARGLIHTVFHRGFLHLVALTYAGVMEPSTRSSAASLQEREECGG